MFQNRSVGILVDLTTQVLMETSFSADYLDPALAWVGVKDSGRGVSLSKLGAFGFRLAIVAVHSSCAR